jgi:glycosyltransferase involved in cell wall biosynthesis
LWFNFKNKNKKTILLLEMYPPIYKDLIENLKNENYNIIIINRRRPVTLEKESIDILKNSDCKIISEKDLFEKSDMDKILKYSHKFSQKINDIWEHDVGFQKIFKIDDTIFWTIIKDELKEVFQKRIKEYVKLVFFTKRVFQKINVTRILSLYESGETEKAFLKNKNEKIESFLLEHGFSTLTNESKKYGMLGSYDDFTDKIVVWSEFQKEFLISKYKISPKRVLPIGSPRHDILTRKVQFKQKNEKISILIAPTPITQLQGYDTTQIHERFEYVIKNLVKQLQNENVNLIFKIHPSQSEHNNEIVEIIEKYIKKPTIYLLNPVADLIESSDLVVTITPEGWAPSTIMLESMILGKPALNIILDEKIYDFEYIKMNAAIASSFDSFAKVLSKLINDVEYRNEISSNGLLFTKKFLCNYGNSSKILADLLTYKKLNNT